MRVKPFYTTILSTIFLILSPYLSSDIAQEEEQDKFIQSLASLSCYLDELDEKLDKDHLTPSENLLFTEESADLLWNYVEKNIHTQSELQEDFDAASSSYLEAKQLLSTKTSRKKARKLVKYAGSAVESMWIRSLKCAKKKHKSCSYTASKDFANKSIIDTFESNPFIPVDVKNEIRPYLIPNDHPMTPVLNSIFFASRVTTNLKAFQSANFIQVGEARPRSFLLVAKHPALPGYLVKIYLDDELRQKLGKPSWRWLKQRCEGAKKIKEIIQNKKMKHFTVADKWIYPLPANPSPPTAPKYTRHYAILLVTDMQLAPDKVNLHAWKHAITKDHLDELYYIISHAKGSSYRPDNICYTVNKTFTFIDTEYPNMKPDFRRIRPHLSSKMRKYWDRLVTNGGK